MLSKTLLCSLALLKFSASVENAIPGSKQHQEEGRDLQGWGWQNQLNPAVEPPLGENGTPLESSGYGDRPPKPQPYYGGGGYGKSSFGKPPPYGKSSYGMPPPYGKSSYGMPPPYGKSSYGKPPPYGKSSYGKLPPYGKSSYGKLPPYGKSSYGPGGGDGGYGGYIPYYADPDREKNKCELKLSSHVWDYLHYLGYKFPSWCCLLSALAPPSHDEKADYKPEFDHVVKVVEAIFATAQKELGMSEYDMGQAYEAVSGESEIDEEEEESVYGHCKLGFHKCQIVYGIIHAFNEGFSACYCYYRSFEGCQCSSCMSEDLWVDEAAAYLGIKDGSDDDFASKLVETRIATCQQCPGKPPMPFNKCYGYCNLVGALPYTDICFPEKAGYTDEP